MPVPVLDGRGRPLMPCSEKRARLLLDRGRAVVAQASPFAIRLEDRKVEDSAFQPLAAKFDPGSKTTGVAVVREGTDPTTGEPVGSMVLVAHLLHRQGITKALDARRSIRRRRRGQLWHRPKRFDNRRRTE
ncbi:MAG: RRXRR domain-containing protein, partial [Acidimicrobiales bacterium]